MSASFRSIRPLWTGIAPSRIWREIVERLRPRILAYCAGEISFPFFRCISTPLHKVLCCTSFLPRKEPLGRVATPPEWCYRQQGPKSLIAKDLASPSVPSCRPRLLREQRPGFRAALLRRLAQDQVRPQRRQAALEVTLRVAREQRGGQQVGRSVSGLCATHCLCSLSSLNSHSHDIYAHSLNFVRRVHRRKLLIHIDIYKFRLKEEAIKRPHSYL